MTKAIFIFLVFALIIGECLGGTLDNEIIPPNPENTATPTLIVKTATPTSTNEPKGKFHSITSSQVNDFVWSADSKQVFYSILGDASWWTYDLEKEEIYFLGDDYPFDNPPGIPNFPYPVHHFEYSPSGEKGLFLVFLYPTPTIPPTADGEYDGYADAAELWYWENGQTRKLGIITSCIHSYLWSHDENRVVIQTDFRIGPCENTPLAWLVDLNANSIETLVLEENDTVVNSIAHFSPDDQRLLYVRDNTLSIIDIYTFEVRELETPDLYFLGGDWISDDILLTLYAQDELDDFPSLLALFDINASEFTPLMSENYPEAMEGLSVKGYAISPDKKRVAFRIGAFSWEIEGLWLLRLPEK